MLLYLVSYYDRTREYCCTVCTYGRRLIALTVLLGKVMSNVLISVVDRKVVRLRLFE